MPIYITHIYIKKKQMTSKSPIEKVDTGIIKCKIKVNSLVKSSQLLKIVIRENAN